MFREDDENTINEERYMAVDDYDDRRHMARDVRDAHVSASAAKTLATLALIAAAIALALSVMAWNKANDAWGNSERAMSITQSS
jgi:TRAP-type C4-dicarboxylate transport system permease small subunit